MIQCKKIISLALLFIMMATMFSTTVFAGGSSSTSNYLICGSCGKEATYEYNIYTKELKILGRGEIKDFKEYITDNYWTNKLSTALGVLGSAASMAITTSANSNSVKLGTLGSSGALGFLGGQTVGGIFGGIADIISNNGTVPWKEYILDIEHVTVSDGITKIGKNTFASLKNLKDVKIANSVKEIGIGAFYECTSLTSITIGNGVKQIDNYAFCRCENLTNVTYNGKSNPNNGNAFKLCPLQEVKVLPCYEEDTFCGIKVTKG